MKFLRYSFTFGISLASLLVIVACAPAPTPAPPMPTVPPPTFTAVPPTATQALPTNTPFPSPTPGPVSFVWKSTGDPELKSPNGIALDKQGNIYVFDPAMARISKFDRDLKLVKQWGSSGAGDGQFMMGRDRGPLEVPDPIGNLRVDAQGNIYVVDAGNWRIQKFDSNGKFLMAWGSQGKGEGQFMRPEGLALDEQGNVYVVDDQNERIQKFDSTGKFLSQFGSTGTQDGQFISPRYLTVDAKGNIYLADNRNYRVQKFDNSGKFLTKWDKCGEINLVGPAGVAVDNQGNLYVSDYGTGTGLTLGNRICKFDATGKFVLAWGGKGSGDGQLYGPTDIAVDSDGNVYVVNLGNARIQKFRQQ